MRSPFDIVKVQPADGFHELDYTYRLIEDYSRYKVNQYYGISLDQFFLLPQHIVLHMFEIAKIRQAKESNSANPMVEELEKQIKEQNQTMNSQKLANVSFPNL